MPDTVAGWLCRLGSQQIRACHCLCEAHILHFVLAKRLRSNRSTHSRGGNGRWRDTNDKYTLEIKSKQARRPAGKVHSSNLSNLGSLSWDLVSIYHCAWGVTGCALSSHSCVRSLYREGDGKKSWDCCGFFLITSMDNVVVWRRWHPWAHIFDCSPGVELSQE